MAWIQPNLSFGRMIANWSWRYFLFLLNSVRPVSLMLWGGDFTRSVFTLIVIATRPSPLPHQPSYSRVFQPPMTLIHPAFNPLSITNTLAGLFWQLDQQPDFVWYHLLDTSWRPSPFCYMPSPSPLTCASLGILASLRDGLSCCERPTTLIGGLLWYHLLLLLSSPNWLSRLLSTSLCPM